MERRSVVTCALLALLALPATAQSVSVSLNSTQNGRVVPAGAMIDWQIAFAVSAGDNAGLALLGVDLVQGAGNPALLDIPPGGGVPAEMTNFSRPAGICNRGEGGATTGYIGVQRGTAGQKNLIQIGGAQNTTGAALPGSSGAGTNAVVVGGVGQSSSQILASGSFAAPGTPGTYTFSLANGFANTLTQRNDPPAFSPVTSATVVLSPAIIAFTVPLRGDTNCNGVINNFDIDSFVLAVLDAPLYTATFPNCHVSTADTNHDTIVNNFDIDSFVTCVLLGLPAGTPCP